MKTFFETCGSFRGFGDTYREFPDLESAMRAAEEMRRDGLRHVSVQEVTVTPEYRTAHSVKIFMD